MHCAPTSSSSFHICDVQHHQIEPDWINLASHLYASSSLRVDDAAPSSSVPQGCLNYKQQLAAVSHDRHSAQPKAPPNLSPPSPRADADTKDANRSGCRCFARIPSHMARLCPEKNHRPWRLLLPSTTKPTLPPASPRSSDPSGILFYPRSASKRNSPLMELSLSF